MLLKIFIENELKCHHLCYNSKEILEKLCNPHVHYVSNIIC